MTSIKCKKCQSEQYHKNGIVRGTQRYRCKDCGYNFIAEDRRSKPLAIKSLAVLLYAMGGMSLRGIGRCLGVSNVTVLHWVRTMAEGLPEPEIPSTNQTLMLDEMHHFIKKNSKLFGFGERLILSSGELLPGFWVGVMMKPVDDFSKK